MRQMGNLELWYTTITGRDAMDTMTPIQRKMAQKAVEKARLKNPCSGAGKINRYRR